MFLFYRYIFLPEKLYRNIDLQKYSSTIIYGPEILTNLNAFESLEALIYVDQTNIFRPEDLRPKYS